jgi:hypothetical protein
MGQAMFRILYLVVVVGGLLWIIQSRPIWLEPTRAVEKTPRGAAGDADWQSDEDARMDETFRRTKLVVVATIGVIAAGEIWCLLAGRPRLFHRT